MSSSVPPVNGNSTGAAGTTSGNSGSIGGLTMNDFLTLMTAQLRNQDPLDPTDANDFLSEISELSTVEGISQLNTSVTNLSDSMLSSQAVTSASLVGQAILAPASASNFTAGGTLSGAVQVPTGATAATLTISDASGAVVDQIPLSTTAGLQGFSWNGLTSTGAAAPSGVYGVSASAEVGGASQSATTLLTGTVSSVSLGNSGTEVLLNTPQLGPVALSSVQQLD